MRTHHYLSTTSQTAAKLVTFRQQMADFARGEHLRSLREARHLSQEAAAHEIGVTTKALRAWEQGGGIKWENAKAAAAFYRVDPDTLVSRETVDISAPDASQLDRIEDQLEAIQTTLSEFATQLRDALQMPAPKSGKPASKSRSRRAK